MKTFALMTILIAVIASTFALPAFADESCTVGADYLDNTQQLIATGNMNEALRLAACGVESFPESALAYNNRGWVNYQVGDLEAAMEDFDAAIALDEELAYAYNNRGLVWQQMGERIFAMADFMKAISLDFEQDWAVTNLYNLRFELSKIANADSDI